MRALPFTLETVLGIPVLVTITVGVQTKRFTTWGEDVVVGGDTWTSGPGANITDVTFASDGAPSSMDISMSTNNTIFTRGDVARGYYDGWPITVEIFDPDNPDAGTLALMPNATIGSVSETTRDICIISVNGALTRTRIMTTQHYALTCRADLYDSKCKVTRASFTTSVVGQATGDFDITLTTSPNADPTYYVLGLLSFTSNALSGFPDYQIRTWDPATKIVSLFLPVALTDVPAGTTMDISAGCDFTRETCFGKFGNIVNMRAETFVPPTDPRLI